jgi:hypothetical protein
VSFNVGDKVTALGAISGVVKYGPVPSTFGTYALYVVEDETTGRERAYKESDLAPFAETFKAGDQATGVGSGQTYTILAGPFKDSRGQYYVVRRGDGHEVPIHAENLRAVAQPANAVVHDGVTYDLDAEYTDREGDPWRFAVVDGMVRGDYGDRRGCITERSYEIGYAVSTWGPFRKI